MNPPKHIRKIKVSCTEIHRAWELFKVLKNGAFKMAQPLKGLAAKLEDLSSTSGIEGEHFLLQVIYIL